jgi:predicted nucleotidyltransferase
MTTKSSPPFTLKKPPTEDFIRVVRCLDTVAKVLDTPFFLAGAAARDLILVNLWGMSPGRKTADIDFAFAVDDWRQYERLRAELVNTGKFAPDSRQSQRLLFKEFRLPVDFVPFRGVASEAHTIAWPPNGDFVMNIAGFEAAFAAALRVELQPGLTVCAASLPGLAVLKTLAWSDRHLLTNKDAADLYRLLSTYHDAGNEDRLFDNELELLEAVGYDLTLAGSRLLGRDAARLADPAARSQVAAVLKSERLADLLTSHMVVTSTYEENAPVVASLLGGFRDGFTEASR